MQNQKTTSGVFARLGQSRGEFDGRLSKDEKRDQLRDTSCVRSQYKQYKVNYQFCKLHTCPDTIFEILCVTAGRAHKEKEQ